jgi:hypothetical protein
MRMCMYECVCVCVLIYIVFVCACALTREREREREEGVQRTNSVPMSEMVTRQWKMEKVMKNKLTFSIDVLSHCDAKRFHFQTNENETVLSGIDLLWWGDGSKQGILKGEISLYHWPPVWLVWYQLYDNWQFLFLFAKQTSPNQSNRRSMVQWYFHLQYSLVQNLYGWKACVSVLVRHLLPFLGINS